MHLWYSSLAVYDIVGTLTYLDDDMPDAELEQLFAGSELRVHTKTTHSGRAPGLYTPARHSFPPDSSRLRATRSRRCGCCEFYGTNAGARTGPRRDRELPRSSAVCGSSSRATR